MKWRNCECHLFVKPQQATWELHLMILLRKWGGRMAMWRIMVENQTDICVEVKMYVVVAHFIVLFSLIEFQCSCSVEGLVRWGCYLAGFFLKHEDLSLCEQLICQYQRYQSPSTITQPLHWVNLPVNKQTKKWSCFYYSRKSLPQMIWVNFSNKVTGILSLLGK